MLPNEGNEAIVAFKTFKHYLFLRAARVRWVRRETFQRPEVRDLCILDLMTIRRTSELVSLHHVEYETIRVKINPLCANGRLSGGNV